jgi:hypothetical protein
MAARGGLTRGHRPGAVRPGMISSRGATDPAQNVQERQVAAAWFQSEGFKVTCSADWHSELVEWQSRLPGQPHEASQDDRGSQLLWKNETRSPTCNCLQTAEQQQCTR